MTLLHSISQLAARLDARSINFAVIGGMAMALRGVQRATFDLDFLLMLFIFNLESRLEELKHLYEDHH